MKILIPAAIIALSLGFTSCSKDLSEKKTVRLSFESDPLSLDPRIGGDRRSQIVLRSIYEGLTRIGKSGLPEPALAEKIEVSADQTVYTFHLRRAFWSNGLPVTAHDFEYAWKGALSPTFPAALSYAFLLIKNAQNIQKGICPIDDAGIKVLDKNTLQVTLEHPTPYFLELTANPIFSPLCKEFVDNYPSWPKIENGSYVSNGPFVLKEHQLVSHILIEKNPTYWDSEAVKIDRLHFSILRDACTAYSLFHIGELDWFGDPCCTIPIDILSNIKAPLSQKHAGSVFWLDVCTRKPYLSSPKIRKAIAAAVDRQTLTSFLQGGEMPAFSILAPFMSMLKEPSFKDHDVKAASALFQEGLQDIGLTKEQFPTITITHWQDPSTKKIAEIIQEQIQQALNIKISLECVDWATYMKKVSWGDIDLATGSWFSWVADPMYNLNYLKLTDNGINGSGWHNAEYVRELDAADASIDLEERKIHMQKAEQIFADNLPIIPIFYICHRYAKSHDIDGEFVSPVGAFDFKWIERKDLKKTT